MQKCDRKNVLVITPDPNYSDSLVQNVTRVTMKLPSNVTALHSVHFFHFVAECVDVDRHCQLYRSQGFCAGRFTANAMRSLCPRSCDLCQT
jgi:hypothetical protein